MFGRRHGTHGLHPEDLAGRRRWPPRNTHLLLWLSARKARQLAVSQFTYVHVRFCFSSARPRMTHREECSHLRHLFLFPQSSYVRTHVHTYVRTRRTCVRTYVRTSVRTYVRTYVVLLILQVAPGVPGAPGSPPACSAMRSIGARGRRVPRPRGSTAVSAQGSHSSLFPKCPSNDLPMSSLRASGRAMGETSLLGGSLCPRPLTGACAPGRACARLAGGLR